MAFLNAADAKQFALSGQATLTMESERTGAHYTYKIEKATKPRPGNPAYFVSLLMGPNNEADYTYIGMIDNNGFRTTEKSKLPLSSHPVAGFDWIWRWLTIREILPPQCVIRHDGRCGKCGRTLTTPDSIDLGIGPECAKKLGIAKPNKKTASAAAPAWFQ